MTPIYTDFNDIPQMTEHPSYRVDCDWEYFINVWIPEQVGETELSPLQLNPDFQRGHVWTEEQQIAFVEFALRGGLTGQHIYFNHPGWQRSYQGDFVLVDGLQRITAVRRFIHNEIPAFGTYCKDFKGRLPRRAQFVICVNKLKTRAEVLRWYIEMNDGGVVHSSEEIERVRKLMKKAEGGKL